jgi:pre-mRNA-splicing factor SYF1
VGAQEEDLLYEEELLRNPYTLKLWWRYVEARKGADSRRRYLLYERAVKCLPGSYKVPPSPHPPTHTV